MSNDAQPLALVIEDDAVFRRVVIRFVQRRGYRVLEAADGLAGMQHYEQNKSSLSLIVSDVRMPGLEGLDILKHVRKESQLPFIIMSGHSEQLDTQDVFELGASAFLAKPFTAEQLVECISKATKGAA